MIDTLRAIFGKCPWCYVSPLGPYERFLKRMPTRLFMFIEFRLNQFWRLGKAFHDHAHVFDFDGPTGSGAIE